MRWAGAAALVAGLFACGTEAGTLPLKTVARITLPGPSVRFDYMSLDPRTDKLYIAHMDAGRILVVNVRSRRVVKAIPAPGVHGVLAVGALGRVYASATDAGQVLTIDARTGDVLRRAPAGRYPDGLAYDPVEGRVFVSDEVGGVEAVFDASGHRVGTVPLGGEAGNVQFDSRSGRILVDVQSRNEVAVIDPRTNRVVRRVPLAGCDHDHGLLVDPSRRLAFVACDGNAKLMTLDLRRLRVTASAAVGDEPEVLAFDPSLRRLYVASESGTVAVFAEGAHGVVTLGRKFLAPRAHTAAVDPRTHLVYFALERGSSGRPELLVMRPA